MKIENKYKFRLFNKPIENVIVIIPQHFPATKRVLFEEQNYIHKLKSEFSSQPYKEETRLA